MAQFLLLVRRNRPSSLSSSMPSPPIPRSKSAPDISSPISPPNPNVHPPSAKSTRSTGSPVINWPKKKLGEYITRKTKNSNLTEESLQEFNRRNSLVETRYNSSSPYYKGLIDYTLDINREKLSGSSPGRESHATSFVTSGSKTSFAVRVQEWGSSCFTPKKSEKSSSGSSSQDTRKGTSSSSSSKNTESGLAVTKIRTKTAKNESEAERRVTFQSLETENTFISSTKEKPLRERDSETPPSMMPLPLPLPPPPESLPYPLPLVTPPTAQPQELLPTAQTPPPPQASLPSAPLPRNPAAGVVYVNRETNTIENEIKYVWADKYRPFWLQDFLCNKLKALWLQSMIRNWDDDAKERGHFIFEGNPGVGKRTMIWALLREAFGPDKVQARKECKKFYLKGEAVSSILVNLMVSPHHTEVNLSELKGYEKHILVELIKEKNKNLSGATFHSNRENCRAIILYEADKLSTDALSYIKWMLEKFDGCNRVFFCCSDASKLQGIMPLCTFVQLLEPSNEEIVEVLAFIAEKEGIQLPHQLANEIANNSKNNLRQAIRSFEATWHFNGCHSSLKEVQDIKTGWEDKIANIARNVLEEQSPKQLYIIRGELQNLIEHNVAPEFIFQTLREELKKIMPEQLQPQFNNLYDEYQKNHAIKKNLANVHQHEELTKRQNDQRNNVQQFMRIEEFIARFMSWYKGLVIKNKEVDQMQSREAI